TSGTPSAIEASWGVMPKTSGAVLDWVPQKAAQQIQSDAMTRFMPVLASPFPLWCSATRTALSAPHLRSIRAMQSSSRGPRRLRPAMPARGARAASMTVACWEMACAGKAVRRVSSLRCDELFGGAGDLVHLLTGGFRSPAHVPGAEQELLHREPVRDCGEIVPRLDEGIAEHGALHQPEPEGQNQLAADAG